MKILKIEIDSEIPGQGTWTFERKGNTTYIRGKPLPSEAQAYFFEKKVIPSLEDTLGSFLSVR